MSFQSHSTNKEFQMFIFSLPQSDARRLIQGSAVEVKINGVKRMVQFKVYKPGDKYSVTWSDEDGIQTRGILDTVESGSLVTFHCDDGPEQSSDYTILMPSQD